MSTEYLTPQQMAYAEQNCGVSLGVLMDNAGEALARRIRELCYAETAKKPLFLCGKGNNAGDGFVAAQLLSECSVEPCVVLCCGEPKTELAKAAFYKMQNVKVVNADDIDLEGLLSDHDIVVDCIFGTGFSGEALQDIRRILSTANHADVYRVACDIPSGANALTGEAQCAFRADETVTMHRPKIGMALSPARELCGKVIMADIGIGNVVTGISEFCREQAASALPYRLAHGHKGTFGKVVCVCGSESYTGAAAMSVTAALRSGAGLVELCSSRTVIDRLTGSLYEAVYTELPHSEDGSISAEGADILIREIKNADAVLFGCGMGNTEDTGKLIKCVIANAACPIVIDADGINCLSANIDILKSKQAEIILTPHPMELARLCGTDTAPADRYSAARTLCDKYGVTVMAKSAQTFVVGKNGEYICQKGNTALAKGGSGDMLAGLTAGFLAQGAKAETACALASHILGEAAESLAESRSERGIIARDILSALPDVLFNLEN